MVQFTVAVYPCHAGYMADPLPAPLLQAKETYRLGRLFMLYKCITRLPISLAPCIFFGEHERRVQNR